jgi:hypothetical protein
MVFAAAAAALPEKEPVVVVMAVVTEAPALPPQQTPAVGVAAHLLGILALQLAALADQASSVSGGLNKETTCNTHSSKTMRLKT